MSRTGSDTTLGPDHDASNKAPPQHVQDPEKQSPVPAPSARATDTNTGGAEGQQTKDEQHASSPSSSESSPSRHDPAFEVSWEGPDDPLFPHNFPRWRKWLQVSVTSSSALCVTCTSSLYASTYDQIEREFGCSRIVATLGLSLFVVGLGLSPLLLGPLSEFYGRKPIYIVSLSIFVIWLIPCAVAQNIETEIVARFFDGFAGSAFLTVAGGTVGDLFDKYSLTAPMIIFTSSPLLIRRWSFYVLIIWSVVQLLAIVLFVPETYHPVLLRNKARKLRKETGDSRWHAPIEKLDRSIAQGIQYLFFGAFAVIYERNYGFNLWQVGMSFTGIGVGMLVAVASFSLWHNNYLRLVRNRKHEGGDLPETEPEFRLPPAIAGAPMVTVGLMIFSWTVFPSVHWIASQIGSAVFGCGVILVFSGVFTFLVDAYPLYAASALSANSFARSSFAAAFPLFGVQMYNTMGFQWASFLLAMLSLVMAPFPYIFFKYGKNIRKKSKFASSVEN